MFVPAATERDDGRRALLKDGDGDASAGGMLQDFITEFAKQRTIVVTRLQNMRDLGDGSSWQEEAKAAEKGLEEMESTRRQVQVQLRLELSGVAGSEKQQWDTRLQDWSKEASSLRGELASIREEQNRRSLLGTGQQASQRAAAMQSTELLQQSSKRIEEMKMQALETEEVSLGILSDLHSQRETIVHMRSNMGIVSSELSSAARTLTRLIRGAERKKLLTSVVAYVLALGVTMWLLSYCGMSLPKTLLVAACIVVLTAAGLVVRQRLRDRNMSASEP